jgi:hypothetical protein
VREGRAICDEERMGQIVNLEGARQRRIEVNEWFDRMAVAF